MALDQIDQFMQALGALESGNNYKAVGPTHPTMGPALGRWQIMQSNWDAWSSEAGIPGANWRDPKAQDRVASFKFAQYYRQFGSWPLVAVAWFAGPGRAAKAAKQGIDSVGNLSDSLGTTVAGYVKKVMSGMGAGSSIEGASAGQRAEFAGADTGPPEDVPEGRPSVEDTLVGASRIIEPADEPEEQVPPQPRDLLTAVFESVSRKIAGGQRTDPRTLGADTARPAEGPGQRPTVEQSSLERVEGGRV